jgi:hypothetical protein
MAMLKSMVLFTLHSVMLNATVNTTEMLDQVVNRFTNNNKHLCLNGNA